jgi:hypothetical protein
VTQRSIVDAEPSGAVRAMLLVVGAAAVLAGLYGRFAGLGTWPLGVDEFYISRSIDNVLRSGLPAFPCGGYYTRGLIYQYVVAALRLIGWTPEFAGRFVAATSSLAVLPAAYLLGKRLQSALGGWLAVIILSVSVWEIEMARFARMYAPFQAVFAWYLVAYLRFTVERRAAALGWMAALSLFGVLVWEGGVLLGVANLFAILAASDGARLERRDWGRLALLGALLGALYLATRDLRGFADAPAIPGVAAGIAATPLQLIGAWFAPLGRHPGWALGLLVPLAFVTSALRWIAGFRGRPLAAAGLAAALAAAAVHAFGVVADVLLVMLLLRLVERRALAWRSARYFWLALGGFLAFWLTVDMAAGTASTAGVLKDIVSLVGFPDIYDHVFKPWLRTVPVLSASLFVAFAYWCWRCIAADRTRPDAAALLVSVTIVLVLAVGATPTDRIETRYTFFLYPLLIVLAVGAQLRFVGTHGKVRIPALVTACVPLLCFAATEDFQPQHVRDVDSARVNYRVGMSAHRVEHYYPRNDIRGVAQWLATQVQPGDVVVTGIPSLDEYYGKIDYFFLDDADNRYEAYVCPDGRTERWSNRPVLYTADALKPILAARHRVFASVFGETERHLNAYAPAAGWSVRRVWTADSHTASVILITQAGPP